MIMLYVVTKVCLVMFMFIFSFHGQLGWGPASPPLPPHVGVMQRGMDRRKVMPAGDASP